MSKPVYTISPETSLDDALSIMEKEHVRRLPVVDRDGSLVGIVTEQDLIKASPSEATLLDKWEIKSLMSTLPVEKVMTRQMITLTEDVLLEEAARIMADKKVSGLPVVRGNKVVGMLTESDIFKIFLEMMGARQSGIRLSFLIANKPGQLAKLSHAVSEIGGDIITMGTFTGSQSGIGEMMMKVSGVSMDVLKEAIAPFIVEILDARETKVV
ncbi:MAG TPA: CBS domain-containing protein [Anaerolineaceae bacterium]|nr:CBS domain-containing protein [Anaerolineaceae bacterium]HQN04955.1 CBS domain-containing protein [Anaerolineaceae bacterium]HQP07789.1 CBS domain-containing protein [Anaerolineaceae bacterium]